MSHGRRADVDFDRLPEHVAIIMDGNGRWASKRLLTKNMGHKAGAETLRKLAERMNGQGFKRLTVFAFSTENWKRPEDEIRGLMTLLKDYIQQYINDSKKNDMQISVIGDISRLDQELQGKINYLTELTREYTGLRLTIAINYGGRDELIRAARAMCDDAAAGRLSCADIDEERFAGYLDTRGMPDPELLIRTSGELRLSNFMLWQTAYSEMYVCPKLWPDFEYDDLLEAVGVFQGRERRFGGR